MQWLRILVGQPEVMMAQVAAVLYLTFARISTEMSLASIVTENVASTCTEMGSRLSGGSMPDSAKTW
jgi:hypothetical protein